MLLQSLPDCWLGYYFRVGTREGWYQLRHQNHYCFTFMSIQYLCPVWLSLLARKGLQHKMVLGGMFFSKQMWMTLQQWLKKSSGHKEGKNIKCRTKYWRVEKSKLALKQTRGYKGSFKVLSQQQQQQQNGTDNIHIDEPETILKNNPLSLSRSKDYTRLTPQTGWGFSNILAPLPPESPFAFACKTRKRKKQKEIKKL